MRLIALTSRTGTTFYVNPANISSVHCSKNITIVTVSPNLEIYMSEPITEVIKNIEENSYNV